MLNYIPGSTGSAAGGSSPFRASGPTVNRFNRALPFGMPSVNLTPARKLKR